MPFPPRPIESAVVFEVDGSAYALTTWSDMSALLAVRLIARHATPRRGCEAGLCGSCESLVDGVPTRLCQLPSPRLHGTVVTTTQPAPPPARRPST